MPDFNRRRFFGYNPDLLLDSSPSSQHTVSPNISQHNIWHLNIGYRGRRSGKQVRLRELHQIQPISCHVTQRDFDSKFASCSHSARTVDYRNLVSIKPSTQTSSSSSSKLHFGLWNAQSIRGKSATVCDLVISNKLDILAITETWLKGNNCDNNTVADIKETLQGFDFVNIPRPGRRGGGIGVLFHKGFGVKYGELFNFKSMEYTDLTFTYNRSHLRLIVVYRPPSSKKNTVPLSVFFDEFATLLELLNTSSGHLLITGDFNFHVDTPDDPNAAKFLDLLLMSDLQQHVVNSTHRHGHTLDLIISRIDNNFVSDLTQFTDVPSDHNALLCFLNTLRPKPCKKLVTFRRTKSIDINLFKSDLLASPLLTTVSSADLDVLVDQYNKVLGDLINKHAPVQSHIITCRPNAPWFSDDLHKQKVIKRRYERKWLSSGLEIDKQIFKTHCHFYTNLMNASKTEYYRSQVRNASQTQLFQFVDKLSNVRSAQILPSHESAGLLSERFSQYFSEKIANLLESSPGRKTCNLTVPLDYNATSDCHVNLNSFSPLSAEKLKNIITGSPSKSCELDPIPTWFLKNCIDVALPALLQIVNTSLSTGTFPDQFKMALVRPLIKKPTLDPELLSNYRPISNLPFISKVLERVVSVQLNNYLCENSLFARMQSGYRKYHSVETALVRVFNDLLLALDDKNEAILVLLDLSAAFDTVNHQLLLYRLSQRFGISGSALSWLKSYLNGRSQTVIVGENRSAHCPTSCGVPQGSVLGPLLFTLYISPIEDIITNYNLNPMFYADDSQIYLMLKRAQREQGVASLENCIADLNTWLTENDLLLNAGKTEIIHITSRFDRNPDMLSAVNVDGKLIKPSNVARDLGLIVDRHLDLQAHISQLCRSSSNAIRMIGNLRKYLDQKQTETLIHAYLTSRLDNCNSLFYALPDYLINKLQRIQNTAARLVTLTKKRHHITPVLRQLHWLPVKQRIIYKILLLTFKALQGKSPVYISELLKEHNPTRTLRSSNKKILSVPAARTATYGERAFSVCAPKLWNSLPLQIRSSRTVDTFKTHLKTHLFNAHFNNI